MWMEWSNGNFLEKIIKGEKTKNKTEFAETGIR